MTNFFNAVKKFEKVRFHAGLLVIGLFFVVIGGVGTFMPKSEMMEAEAVIQDISVQKSMNDEAEYEYTVLVNYTDADGRIHKNIEYGGYSTGMKPGQKIPIAYNVDNPELIRSPGTDFLPVVFLILGLLCAAAAIVFGKKAIRIPAEEMNELNRAERRAVDPALAEEVRNSSEPQSEYYFHFTGKLNQSYIMETPQRTAVYKANCDKIGVMKPFLFTFENCEKGTSVTCEVTHITTVSYGNANGFSIPESSNFTIDGENNWDYLARLGYSLEMKLHGIHMNFDVSRYGVKVARIEAAGANILKEDADSVLGEVLPGNGLYKVWCRKSDIEGVFMACFCVSRVEFF